MHHSPLISRAQAVVVVVDVQQKLFPLMQEPERLLRRCVQLVTGAATLGVPVIVSEQYPRGLGATVPELTAAAAGARVVAKDTFSCLGNPEFAQALRDTERRQVVVCGIETHICVLQTCFDARAQGYDVYLVADAVASRLPHTGPIGLERMRQAGIAFTTVEGTLFEMLARRDAPEFKAVLELVRNGE